MSFCPLDQQIVADLVAACSLELIGTLSGESSANQNCTSCKQSLKGPEMQCAAAAVPRQPSAEAFERAKETTRQQAPELELLI